MWANSGDSNGEGAYAETFLDGESVGVSSEESSWGGFNMANPDGQLIIGGDEEDAGSRAFTGLLDEIALFAGVVPSPDIAAIAAGQIKPTDLDRPAVSMDMWLSGFALNRMTDFSDDPDGEGLPNGLEFALGSMPMEHNPASMTLSRSTGSMTLQHPHNELFAGGVELSYPWSSDLINYQQSGESSNVLTVSLTPIRNVPSGGGHLGCR